MHFKSAIVRIHDPLADVVTLLQPQLAYTKIVHAGGAWRVRRDDLSKPFYAAIVAGATVLTVDGHAPLALSAGDFVLVPAASGITMGSGGPLASDFESLPVAGADGTFVVGTHSGTPDAQLLVGHCEFGAPDSALLISLLPRILHVRGQARLATMVDLLGEESRAQRPGRDIILGRLLEVLFIEALRGDAGDGAAPGLLRGLADERLAIALRHMHADIARPWTVAALASLAALSRSTFFERFNKALGVAPMEYLLAWRMARAKQLLLRHGGGVAEVAQQVGYGSASAFSVAFARHVGQPPMRFARADAAPH